jgi:hypothetical protein
VQGTDGTFTDTHGTSSYEERSPYLDSELLADERTKRYGGRVNRNLAKRTCAVAWLLCALLSYLTINPPHCDVCDRIFLVYASSRTSVHQHTPATPDTCNGLCSCCGLQGVPISSPVQVAVNTVTSGNPPELPWPALTPASSVFRPPRLAVFS